MCLAISFVQYKSSYACDIFSIALNLFSTPAKFFHESTKYMCYWTYLHTHNTLDPHWENLIQKKA